MLRTGSQVAQSIGDAEACHVEIICYIRLFMTRKEFTEVVKIRGDGGIFLCLDVSS